MKKSHKSKAQKASPKSRRDQRTRALELLPHTSRRQTPASAHPRRPVRPEPAIYRQPNVLAIETADDRKLLQMLLLPFVVMALFIGIVPSLHVYPTLRELIASTPQISAPQPGPDMIAMRRPAPIAATAPSALREIPIGVPPSSIDATQPRLATLAPATAPPHLLPRTTDIPTDVPQVRSSNLTAVVEIKPPLALLSARREFPGTLNAANAFPERIAAIPAPRQALSALRAPDHGITARAGSAEVSLAMIMVPPPTTPTLLAVPPPSLEGGSCPVVYGSAAPMPAAFTPKPASDDSLSFGRNLAQAAVAQTSGFVIYDDKYRQISRTGGDVPPLYGVCTDVVIRAYRALGVDLQSLVQASRMGAGDPNIDHRRTETLRRFLARYGTSLPVTPFGEEYAPGDIVTYWRPQNSGSRSHIAIVADAIGPSGNPMIIHNRGWGPQMEDGLFVDQITGHYRYDGTAQPPQPSLATSSGRGPLRPSATPITLRPSPQSPARSLTPEDQPAGL